MRSFDGTDVVNITDDEAADGFGAGVAVGREGAAGVEHARACFAGVRLQERELFCQVFQDTLRMPAR